jgi:hypothetical protein
VKIGFVAVGVTGLRAIVVEGEPGLGEVEAVVLDAASEGGLRGDVADGFG